MNPYIRSYKAETKITPGFGVVAGADEKSVKIGAGDFIGAYGFENGKVDKDINEHAGIQINGLVKVLLGAAGTAGKKAVLRTANDGTFANCPTATGNYQTVGLFLESGVAGEYVDMFIERNNVVV